MQVWREAIEARDLETLMGLLAEGVVFRSPVVFTPYHGREQVGVLLAAVGEVLTDVRFERHLASEDAADHALVFRARVGEREVEGCDFLHVGDDGLIDELFVMVRPLTALLALAEAMSRRLGLTAAPPVEERGAPRALR